MFIDLHMHEKTCSKDSFLSLEEMVELAKKRVLGAIVIVICYAALGLIFKLDKERFM